MFQKFFIFKVKVGIYTTSEEDIQSDAVWLGGKFGTNKTDSVAGAAYISPVQLDIFLKTSLVPFGKFKTNFLTNGFCMRSNDGKSLPTCGFIFLSVSM